MLGFLHRQRVVYPLSHLDQARHPPPVPAHFRRDSITKATTFLQVAHRLHLGLGVILLYPSLGAVLSRVIHVELLPTRFQELLGLLVTRPCSVVGILHQPLGHHHCDGPTNLPAAPAPGLPPQNAKKDTDFLAVPLWIGPGVSVPLIGSMNDVPTDIIIGPLAAPACVPSHGSSFRSSPPWTPCRTLPGTARRRQGWP